MTKGYLRPFQKLLPWYFKLAIILLLFFLVFMNVLCNITLHDNGLLELNTMFLGGACFFYGFLRVTRFHPICNRNYLQSLVLYPWSPEKELLQGPIHLFWPDIFILLFFVGLGFIFSVMDWLILINSTVAGYLFAHIIAFSLTKQKYYAPFILFVFPFTVYPHQNSIIAFFMLVALYLLCVFGTKQYLEKFPWNTSYWVFNEREDLIRKSFEKRILQWPYSYLCSHEQVTISVLQSIIITVITFVWIHVLVWLAKVNIHLLSFYIASIIAITTFRLLSYTMPYGPPISFWGRLMNRRFIIPDYDKVLCAPILTAVVGGLGPLAFDYLGMSVPLNYELSLVLALFIALTFPPKYEKWKYTGPYRMVRQFNKPIRSVTGETAREQQYSLFEKLFTR